MDLESVTTVHVIIIVWCRYFKVHSQEDDGTSISKPELLYMHRRHYEHLMIDFDVIFLFLITIIALISSYWHILHILLLTLFLTNSLLYSASWHHAKNKFAICYILFRMQNKIQKVIYNGKLIRFCGVWNSWLSVKGVIERWFSMPRIL